MNRLQAKLLYNGVLNAESVVKELVRERHRINHHSLLPKTDLKKGLTAIMQLPPQKLRKYRIVTEAPQSQGNKDWRLKSRSQ